MSCTNSILDYNQPQPIIARASVEPKPHTINSTRHRDKENEPIYVNQLDCQVSNVETDDSHQYATIDSDDPIVPNSDQQERVKII